MRAKPAESMMLISQWAFRAYPVTLRHSAGPSMATGSTRSHPSGHVAILEQNEREEERCSTIQYAITECWQNVGEPRDDRPGGNGGAGVEELQGREGPGEQSGHKTY